MVDDSGGQGWDRTRTADGEHTIGTCRRIERADAENEFAIVCEIDLVDPRFDTGTRNRVPTIGEGTCGVNHHIKPLLLELLTQIGRSRVQNQA